LSVVGICALRVGRLFAQLLEVDLVFHFGEISLLVEDPFELVEEEVVDLDVAATGAHHQLGIPIFVVHDLDVEPLLVEDDLLEASPLEWYLPLGDRSVQEPIYRVFLWQRLVQSLRWLHLLLGQLWLLLHRHPCLHHRVNHNLFGWVRLNLFSHLFFVV